MLVVRASPDNSSSKQEHNAVCIPSGGYGLAEDTNGAFFVSFRWPRVEVQS